MKCTKSEKQYFPLLIRLHPDTEEFHAKNQKKKKLANKTFNHVSCHKYKQNLQI